ncbi:HET-domain-containing protein [Stipitochalara longipes BDJ]|nr:HET-domain-containing protein [Stipitochalara longipes BDJ]
MRLLHTKTLKLHEFFGTRIPPYAILSHTWGDGEVSLQELLSDSGKSKPGFNKIQKCCEMAALDGFEYAWVDTCCIDKTSSAELSEAINSMYSWYRMSEVCYIYLADVLPNLDIKAREEAIRKSRWFTRGWTLQELIAPSSVIFFNQHWGDLGTKESLNTLITDITRINGEVLRDADKLEAFSVAQKMSWASMRETTRVEDIAYCLLGIFGVHIPMLYDEGKHAFIRLQEEIMRITPDHSIFAWTHRPNLYGDNSHGLLALSPYWFVNSGKIVQSTESNVSPFSTTNKGIHLYLRIKNHGESNHYFAVLDCHYVGNDTERLGIYIRKQFGLSDIFQRISCEKLREVKRAGLGALEQRNIFINQQQAWAYVPSYHIHRISLKGLQEGGLALEYSVPKNPFLTIDTSSWPNNFSGYRFRESHYDDGFFVIVRQFGTFDVPPSLTAKIFDNIPEMHSPNFEWSLIPEDEKLNLLCLKLRNDKTWKPAWSNQFSDRVSWQHPIRKWWINLTIKREFQETRINMINISWHALEPA